MTLVAGVDFGTLSVRVSIFDDAAGRLGAGVAPYPLDRGGPDPDRATQRHEDHLASLELAFAKALAAAEADGRDIAAVALATTGSSVVPLDARLKPIDDYYLWCDHRAWREAAEITEAARAQGLAAIDYCGGAYSSEWGWAKLLHWLRRNPDKRDRFATAAEHCDVIAVTLCGIEDPAGMPRSICAMGHKWMWNAELGGLPPEPFLASVDPLLSGMRDRIGGRYGASDRIAGGLSRHWAERLGLREGIPVPVGALDAHWDAIGVGCRLGDVINVLGTSSCIMALSDRLGPMPGINGVVQGSIHPGLVGIEAGLAAAGDLFDAIAKRAGRSVGALSELIAGHRAGSTGLLRLCWDNGDRSALADPLLRGATIGWRLHHDAADELFAAIEGVAFHTRIVLERMAEHGAPIARVINAGGIPQRSAVLNRVFAGVLNKPVLVPAQDPTSMGAAIFAFMAAGTFDSVEAAQDALCPPFETVEPDAHEAARYEELFGTFRAIYFDPRWRDLFGRVREGGA